MEVWARGTLGSFMVRPRQLPEDIWLIWLINVLLIVRVSEKERGTGCSDEGLQSGINFWLTVRPCRTSPNT